MSILGLGFALLAVSPPVAAKAVPPRVEVAFVLDTTGSMGGLIEGAKRRIWSIARRIGEGRPRPDLRLGLVAYRDRGDAYVTQVHDLTGDMDAVYRALMSFHADGGGDGPEHVSAALHDAVHRVSWSQGPGLKVIFLVGDAPPHVDYQDGLDYRRHAREAAARGIVIETIQCGADEATAAVWREIASLAAGHYARIDAHGGMPVRVTPVDAELARLNGELSATVVAGGTVHEQAAAASRLAARKAMPAPMAAEAASYYAGAGALADKDLVDLPEPQQKKELGALRGRGDDPAALRGKTDAQVVLYLRAQKGRRAELQARILDLQARREAYLKADASSKDGFDEQVVAALRERAAAVGVKF
jgi:von Willebrand factor type A domain-containing protein